MLGAPFDCAQGRLPPGARFARRGKGGDCVGAEWQLQHGLLESMADSSSPNALLRMTVLKFVVEKQGRSPLRDDIPPIAIKPR